MDFFQISTKEIKGGALEVYPDWIVGRSKDLMVRAKNFYAVWDEKTGLWSTDEYDVQRLVDEELYAYAQKHDIAKVKYMRSFSSNGQTQFRKFMSQISDNSHQLDNNLTFANTVVKKSDYVSRRLPYNLAPGDHSAWDEMVSTLYSPEEKEKIEWAIGAVVSGDSRKIQKFLVLYGPPGWGKGTILDILMRLFEGYTTTFDAKSLVGNSNAFATEAFKGNPLVAIQQDGDLSKIEDNTKLNSIISHEEMSLNEKYKPSYTARIIAFLFMGTNSPVKISDAKSGLLRRLIDVQPTGNLIPTNHYHTLRAKIDFELGAIAHHCLEVYRELGKNYYNSYRPLEMMLQTDVFFNFIEAHFDIFSDQDGVSLKQAYTLYKEFCDDSGIERGRLPQYKVREELRNYFDEFKDRVTIDGVTIRSYYSGFNAKSFKAPVNDDKKTFSLVMEEETSLLDVEFAHLPAQGYKEDEFGDKIPLKAWSKVTKTLADIDTSNLHYVKVPEEHIVIDFDLKDEKGEKSLELNLEAASAWPATYAELSQGENGVHLHYNYEGDVTQLALNYSDGVEVKTLLGDASLRRRLTKCNSVPVATISSGLPFKEKKKMLDSAVLQSERGLRDLIARNLRKEIHPGTKPSIDFILKILNDAYESGMPYDVTDLRSRIVAFANNSTNKALPCLQLVQQMKFKSDEAAGLESHTEALKDIQPRNTSDDVRPVFYDVEVYPNLFVVCWKYLDDETVVEMINPSPQEIEAFMRLKLVGYNNRRYDNHILWARSMGYSLEQLYKLSKKIVENVKNALFGEAYKISYADVYDYLSKKQSLKKWQIELGIPHKEMDLPWDEPVPEHRIKDVVAYCCNDVRSLEEVFKARKGDFDARKILAELSGLTVNDTTQKHTAAIIFNGDRNPQRSFVYTHLEKEFPGYKYDFGKSTYRDEITGEGGYVYAEPGMYEDVALNDVTSMHPTSIKQLNLFGQYTPKFVALLDARTAVKNAGIAKKKGNKQEVKRYLDEARGMLNGRLAPFLKDEDGITPLSDALKIVINIVYGLTSAKFDNPFRDIRNKDNIVAKRGALFMIDLKHMVQEAGFQVAHIKTDSVKIPGATPWIIEEIQKFAEKYGYNFEHEATYDKLCLVNDAVYIAKEETETGAKWTAVGAQFQHPYVFKTLFSHEPITFQDLCETKQVTQGSLHLDFEILKPSALADRSAEMHFIGRTGRFVPVHEGYGGGVLYRVKEGKSYAAAGTKGYLWVEADIAMDLPQEAIDMGYFEALADDAVKTINKFGDFEEFVS